MGVSLACQCVWVIVAVFVFVPRLNMGLLSDYKICGDPECESLMSRVQAIKEHQSEDCRFLSFRRGEIIFVYHKLTGKRDDLWAGSIDKQFGYFPKDAVREEQVYATTEKVVETQKSDFFCMDESGYPVDTAYLDNDDRGVHVQESKTTQMNPNVHERNPEGPFTSADPSTESMVEAQEAKEDKHLRDAAEPQEEAQKTSAAQEEQGGSASSAWLGSSVTGWFQLPKEELSGNLEEGEKEDEPDASVTSSVTGWLGFGGELKPDETKESVKPQEDSFTSTMTGWLGFGGQKKTDSTKDEQHGETNEETEPTETFRGRRMSLDLEESDLHEEEKEDMGTLGWLGSGLSSRLGFGQNKPDPAHEATSGGEGGDEQEQTEFWMDVGIGRILGFGEDKNKESEIKELENDKNVEQIGGSDSGGNSGSKAPLTDEEKMETNNDILEPTRVPRPEPVRADHYDDVYNLTDSPVRRESSILDAEHEDVSPQAETSSDNFSTTNDNNLKDDEDLFVGTEAEVSQMFDLMENVEETQTKEPVENIITSTSNNQDFLTPSNSTEHSLDGFSSNSTKPSEHEDEEDQTQSRAARAETTNPDDHLEESDHEEATDLPQRDVFSPQTEESAEGSGVGRDAKEQVQLLLISQERNDEIPGEGCFTSPTKETNDDDANAPDDDTEIHRGELEPTEGSSQEVGLLYSGGNASVEDQGITLPNETPDSNQTLESPILSDNLDEAVKDENEETRKEVLGFREDILSLNNLKSTLSPETGSEEMKETEEWENEANTGIKEKDEEKKKEVNEGNEEEEEQLREVEDMKKNEKMHVDRKIKEEKLEDSREEENDELKGKQSGEEEELKEEEKQVREVERSEEANENEKNEEEKQEEERELEKIQRDVRRPDLESNRNQTLENSSLSVSEGVSHIKTGEEKEEEKVKDGKMEEDIVEKQEMISSQDNRDAAVVEAGSSEDGGSSAGEAAAATGGQGEDSADDKASNNTVRENDEEERKTDDRSEYDGDREELSAQTHQSVESLVQSPEQSPSEDSTDSSHPSGSAGSESSGAFGLFKNPFGFFSQTPNPAAAGSTESLQRVVTRSAEESEPQTSEPESSSTMIPPNQAQLMHTVPPTELPYPTSTESTYRSAPSTAEPAPKTKTLTKQYQNLLVHMSADEIDVLLELFGHHKLQFLDYILASSEAVTAGDDLSILSDIEGLLHHHTETLVAPSMRLTEAPQEDKDKTRALIALQKLEMLLKTIKDSFSVKISDVSKHQGEEKKESSQDSPAAKDKSNNRDEQMRAGKDRVGAGATKEKKNMDEGRRDTRSEGGTFQEGLKKQTSDFIHDVTKDSNVLAWLTLQVVSSLPDDMQPGPDLYGVPWEPVIITGLVGLVTCLLFTCRCYSSVKSRMYRSKERWMSEQIAQLLDEKCKVLETLSQCQQEYDDLENSLRDGGVLAQTQKTEHLGVQARQLEGNKKELGRDLDHLKNQLEQQREQRREQERRISVLEENIKTIEEETKDLQSQEEQAQTTLKIYEMNSGRLQRNLETMREENVVLQESNIQLRQQVEGWAERVSELETEMQRCEAAHSAMLQDVANKDERITSLTDRLLRMKGLNPELEEEESEEGGEKEATNGTSGKADGNEEASTDAHLQKVQKLIYAAKLNADLKSVDEDKDRVFAKLNYEIKAKEDLQFGIKDLENEMLSLQLDSRHYSEEVERLQQKLQIMTEMYQENELKLHRMLTVEEKERLQKEEKLNKADKNIAMALEELNNYRKRAEEMEEELEKTKQSYQTQISAHEKKAHNNWLAARAAERELGDIRRENALFRQKLTDTQFKLDSLDKDPFALNSLARPLPFRGERLPYGPSPLGRPSSETRPFLSPPTLMDGPPARLSPRVSRGPVEPPGGQGEMERSGGPHSDSGSNSPTWERDRRGPPPGPPGPLGPPGYMFPEPGGPMFRRAPPPPAALGFLPPPGPLPPRGLPPVLPHPADLADGSFREPRLGPGDPDLRLSGPGDRRTPSESDPRMGGPPLPGPPMIAMDGPFPHRAPYGPPPDFYPPRGPGLPPMMPMWPPPRQGIMLPPRLPPGGPSLPPMPHPNMPPYGPPMGHPPLDGLPPSSMGPAPPQQSLASPPHHQSPEIVPSPEDAI